MPRTLPTINATARRTEAARIWLAAKAAADAAEAALKEARETLVRVCPDEGAIEFDGHRITISQTARRSFDVDVLASLVDDATFASVTKPAVDVRAWDGFVATGDISDKVIDAVVTVTPSTTIKGA